MVYGALLNGLRSPDPLLTWTILVVVGVLVFLLITLLPVIWLWPCFLGRSGSPISCLVAIRWMTAIGILVVVGIGRLEVSSAAAHWYPSAGASGLSNGSIFR